MQHLGRADAIENLQTSGAFPAVEDLRGQRFAGRDTLADGGEIENPPGSFCLPEDGGIKSRDRKENRGPIH